MQLSTSPTIRLQQCLDLLSQGRYKDVHAVCIEMIKKNVKDAVPYCLLACIAGDYGNHTKACELFDKAVELDRDNAYYQAYYGKALTTMGNQQKAKVCADRASGLVLENALEDAHLADTIGVIYSRTGFHEMAVPFFENAVALNDKPANFHYNLAASQQFLGHFERAESAYLETLSRDPKAYRAWSSLVALNKQTTESNHLDALTDLFEILESDEDAALHLGHAIAKTHEDLGSHEASLEWLHKAKRLKLKNTNAELFAYDRLFEAAKTTANAIKDSVDGACEDAPIFIIGLPRTGTTLVDRILSSHADVTAAGELNFFPGLIKEVCKTSSNHVMDVETFMQTENIDLTQIGKKYLEATKELTRGSKRFTDKMPLNFFYAGLIHQALPNARIIALRRGAMDSCLSNYRQLLTVQHSYYHYTYDLQQTAQFYREFDALMSHWREALPADRFMEVHYEKIVFDQENQTRRLLEFCGLDWQEACLRFHENEAPVSTASSVQVRQPLYAGSIGRWQRYGDKLDSLKEALGDLHQVTE